MDRKSLSVAVSQHPYPRPGRTFASSAILSAASSAMLNAGIETGRAPTPARAACSARIVFSVYPAARGPWSAIRTKECGGRQTHPCRSRC